MNEIPKGTEPTEEDIRQFIKKSDGMESYYTAREKLREKSYGGKPPGGYQSWGDYWKSL